MSISLNSIRKGKIQVKALRALLGMRGHRPSQFSINVGKCMKAGDYKPTEGGRWDTTFQGKFISCAMHAKTLTGSGAKVGKAGVAKAR